MIIGLTPLNDAIQRIENQLTNSRFYALSVFINVHTSR
ncbi:hypothetical protein D047_4091 [Vibrio parahaemolyticus VPTS-2010_2]|nr:hypothetical protein D047_4091 [Vibrio parahaemolyticus VPTS-2010_2]